MANNRKTKIQEGKMTNSLTVEEACELYGFSRDCINQNIKKHDLHPKGKIGRSNLYDMTEIEKMLEGVHSRKKRVPHKKQLWKVSIWSGLFWAVQHCSLSRIEAQLMAEEYERNGKAAKISKNIEKR